jgi:hypothetical protein
MTRRSSLRAQAQEIYRAMVAAKATPTPDPSPQGGGEKSLTARVRALYEGSAVPVVEIARLAGVTERTIYKYAAKQNWKPRYRWTADGSRPRGKRRRPRVARGDMWTAREDFAATKGAGGRFIRRADKGKPYAAGLRATDPAGAARAAAVCAEADALAGRAQAEVRRAYWQKQRLRAWAQINRMLGKIADYEEEFRKQHHGQTVPADDVLYGALQSTLAAWMDWLAALRREEAEEQGAVGLATGARPLSP